MPFQFIESPDWPAARERFLEEIQPDDMALLPLERRVGALWTPSLDRLPDIVAERFPGMNMIAAYPALRDSVPEYAFETRQESEARSVIPIALPGTPSLESIFACMARNARLWNRVQQQEIQKLLLDSAQAYPVEMSPGTVLLHAHTEDVAATTILAAYCEQPCRFPGIDRDTRCIVALISPREQTPKRHLAALATLARVFHKKEIVDQIAQATSSEKIAQLLADAMG